MDNINKLSLTLMKRSKSFVFTCIFSICFSVFFINSVYNFSENAIHSYQRSMLEDYGDYDIAMTNPKYHNFDVDVLSQISMVEGVDTLSVGRFDLSVLVEEMDTYLVSVKDDDVMKSRYDYVSDISDHQIIINNILADTLSKEVGDIIVINSKELNVVEIIDDKSFYAGGLALAIISSDTYEAVMERDYHSNFAMIKLDEIIEPTQVIDQITEIDADLMMDVVEMDEAYQKNLISMKAYIIVLAVFVLIISTLFVVGIMCQFLYKYLHDVAIMRAIGGETTGIKKIFIRILGYVVGSACLLGYLLSILLNKIVLGYLNKELQLIKGSILFYFGQSFFISLSIFILIFLAVRISIYRSLKVLPIQALFDNEAKKVGKRKKRYTYFRLSFNNLLWRDWFIARKFIGAKLKENILIILTIGLISAFALVGGCLHKLIQNNNSNYVKSQYLTDLVVTSARVMSLEETNEVRDILMQDQELLVSYYSVAQTKAQVIVNDKSFDSFDYRLATVDTMYHQHILTNKMNDKNLIVVSDEFAKELELKIGTKIVLGSPIEYKYDRYGFKTGIEKESKYYELEVGNILSKEKMSFVDLLIDISYEDFILPYSVLERMFVSGDEEKAIEQLSRLRVKYPGLKWTNYQEVLEYGEMVLKERFFLLELVIEFLVIIAGIGWYNSMRSIIISHKKKYMYLRIQGISRRRIIKIIVIQMFYYIISGVILGAALGFGVLYAFQIYESKELFRMIDMVLIQKVIIFLGILSILQYPAIKQVSSRVDLKLYI